LGGFSAGLIDACHELGRTPNLLAINHWDKAIETHKLNHPSVSHLCENLDNVDPRKVVPNGKLEVLLASPECTHFSNARGGKPMSDQSRASAWHILRWCEALRVENVVVENVKEFQSWGPLDTKGRPIPHKKGELFRKFCECLDVMGYKVDFRVLNSAHYGAATARHRLFIQAVRRRRPRWPEHTHSATPDLFAMKPFRAAREIIDWDLEGQSIFGRKKPLSPKTLKRIEAGLKKFGGVEFVLGQQSCSAPRNLDGPIPTIATAGAISLVEPFLVVLRNNADARSIHEPTPTLCANGNHVGVCEPFLVKMFGNGDGAGDLDKPLPTVTTGHGRMYVAEPFVIPVTHGGGENRCYDLSKPLPNVTGASRGEMALCEPFMVQYYGSSGSTPCDVPLPTVTTKDRFGLCEPQPIAVFERDGIQYALMDIRFRMLQPHELAGAMGLEDYDLGTGTKKDKTKMIGNAVERNTSRALCRAVLQ
jgi:DNA (cytosine-5)-methyltransferase 1